MATATRELGTGRRRKGGCGVGGWMRVGGWSRRHGHFSSIRPLNQLYKHAHSHTERRRSLKDGCIYTQVYVINRCFRVCRYVCRYLIIYICKYTFLHTYGRAGFLEQREQPATSDCRMSETSKGVILNKGAVTGRLDVDCNVAFRRTRLHNGGRG